MGSRLDSDCLFAIFRSVTSNSIQMPDRANLICPILDHEDVIGVF